MSHDEGTYSAEEAQRRFEAAVKAALSTPPQKLKDRPLPRPESKPVKVAKL